MESKSQSVGVLSKRRHLNGIAHRVNENSAELSHFAILHHMTGLFATFCVCHYFIGTSPIFSVSKGCNPHLARILVEEAGCSTPPANYSTMTLLLLLVHLATATMATFVLKSANETVVSLAT